VNEKLVAIGSERAGVRIPTRRSPSASPRAVLPGGRQFSQGALRDVAKAQGLTPRGLDERLRQDYRSSSSALDRDTAFVPKATLDSFIRLSEQTREVSVVNLTPEAYCAKVKVTPEQVKAYYDARGGIHHPGARARRVRRAVARCARRARPRSRRGSEARYEDGMQRKQWGQPRSGARATSSSPRARRQGAERKAAEAKARRSPSACARTRRRFADVAKKESQDPGSAPQGGDLGFFPAARW
jgi:peptidyl-prolyl cis-trans isomerase D